LTNRAAKEFMTNIKKLEKAGEIGKEIISDENSETKSEI
jgi:hypothetical protein